jgi:hypothetical protein
MALGSTQPLTEMSTRNLPGGEGKGRQARKADNLPPYVSRFSRKCGNLDVSQPYGPPRSVTGTDLPFVLHIDNRHITPDSDSNKRQSRPLVREGAPHGQDSKCQRGPNIWPWAPDVARHQDGQTDRQSSRDFEFVLQSGDWTQLSTFHMKTETQSSLRNVLNKNRTMDNVQKHNNCINIASSQTLRLITDSKPTAGKIFFYTRQNLNSYFFRKS